MCLSKLFLKNEKVSQIEVEHVIFYTHQIGGACAGVCSSKRTHQIETVEMSDPNPNWVNSKSV